jgi:hypothetical protein
MAAPLSSNPLNVAARTLTGSNASYSLKAAEVAARCAHTCQGVKPVTEASRGLWRVISAAYGLRKNRSRPNGSHHLARNGLHHLARTSEHHLARTSEHHKLAHTLSIIQGGTLSIIQGGTSEHHPARESRHHLARESRHHPARESRHHLAARGETHLARNSRAHIVAHGRAHIGSNSRAHIVATIRGHLGDANTGQTSGQLATFKADTSRLHLGPTRVGNNNPGAQFFALNAANPPTIRGLYGKQFFIPRTISIAYSIRDAYRSALNDKFCL